MPGRKEHNEIKAQVIKTIKTILINQPTKNAREIREIVLRKFADENIELSIQIKNNMISIINNLRSGITGEPRKSSRRLN